MTATPPEASLAGAQWVRVEFYGLVPPGQRVESVDLAEVGANLMQAFGFTHIDGLTVVATLPGDPP